jgi:hypothetical protein
MLLAVTCHTTSLSVVISVKIVVLLISNVGSVDYEKCVYLLDTPLPVCVFALSIISEDWTLMVTVVS